MEYYGKKTICMINAGVPINFIKLDSNNCQEAVELYNYYVMETTVTYSTEPVTEADFLSYYQVENPLTMAYLLVQDKTTAGFCILRPWNAKKLAYEHTYEISVYLKKECCGLGYGSRAVSFLEDKARAKNIGVIMAGMSYDNVNSVKMFEANGYERCGHFKKVGKKFGKYLDLYYYQKIMETY